MSKWGKFKICSLDLPQMTRLLFCASEARRFVKRPCYRLLLIAFAKFLKCRDYETDKRAIGLATRARATTSCFFPSMSFKNLDQIARNGFLKGTVVTLAEDDRIVRCRRRCWQFCLPFSPRKLSSQRFPERGHIPSAYGAIGFGRSPIGASPVCASRA